jgi:hypothetical protein
MLLQISPCLLVIWKTWCGSIPISGVGFQRKERKAKMSGRPMFSDFVQPAVELKEVKERRS